MRDRKCFSMQLILVVGEVDMINQICGMLSFSWKLLSAYFAEKWLLSTLLSTVVTAKYACIRNTNVCFLQCMHAGQFGEHFNLLPNFEFSKRRHYPIIPCGMQYCRKGRWPMGVVSLVYCLHCSRRQCKLVVCRILTENLYTFKGLERAASFFLLKVGTCVQSWQASRVARWLSGRASDLRSKSRGFEPWPGARDAAAQQP